MRFVPLTPDEAVRGESSSQRWKILEPCVGVGRDKPWGCGQGASLILSPRC